MDFVFSEEEQMGKGKLIPFSCSSSSSPSSSSSHQKSHLISLRWDQQRQPQQQIWLTSNKYDPEDENDRTAATNNNNEESSSSRRRDSDSSAPDLKSASSQIQKEHMFDKVVTPSDVGKLNRLVIPKQYAERFLPLDSSTNEKGLLLSFEDASGKQWKFRYSYWNSSQSYVMTKGWSRFVKEKKLDPGDVVSFQRGVGDVNKYNFFIDWRKRPNANDDNRASFHPQQHLNFQQWSPLLMRPTQPLINRRSHFYSAVGGNVVNSGIPQGTIGSVYYFGSGVAQAAPQMEWQPRPLVFESVPVVQGKATTKRLRLFGVNMECCPTTESDDCEIISSTAIAAQSAAAAPPQYGLPTTSHTLRLYTGTPLLHHQSDFLTSSKGKSSSSSLDLDI